MTEGVKFYIWQDKHDKNNFVIGTYSPEQNGYFACAIIFTDSLYELVGGVLHEKIKQYCVRDYPVEIIGNLTIGSK